ncbi:hypothetical protein [Algiphilus sp.]|uniref:hypothetical protein n=1 Tax=Algiphilus sp. TaxID=1872431 RepID=UPI0025C5C6DD|nr:hypothetical protein [Algiphilus sp.]MCK5771184.1 hypothetical protein [Algiphilus sp.]
MSALPPLWLDAHDLGVRILRNGDDPWLTPGEFGLFQRELAGWLGLDLVDLGLGPALEMARQDAGEAPADGGDIEDLLDGRALQARIVEAVTAVSGALPGRPVVLRLPGPAALARAWLGDDADDDAIDDTAMALAGLARAVFRPGLASIAVEETDAAGLAALQPLINLARHYETPLVLILHGADAPADGFAQVYRPQPADGDGAIVPAAFWQGDGAAPAAGNRFGRVPPDLHPDAVLAGIARLR